jgi:hypothetical protein
MQRSIALVEEMHRGVGMIGGIRTRFGYFDKMTGGLHRKELVDHRGPAEPGEDEPGDEHRVERGEDPEAAGGGVQPGDEARRMGFARLWCAEAEVNFHKLRTGFVSEATWSA